MSPANTDLLTTLLKEVSRSFYLTLRVLPKRIRPQIGLAYLLARTSDTIADTELISPEQRLQALRSYRNRVLHLSGELPPWDLLAGQQRVPAEQVLLQRAEEAIALLAQFSPEDQARIRDVLTTIISGQELDLLRFGDPAEKRVLSLDTQEELDDYTYRVAGCVGEFWTKICRAHIFPDHPLDLETLCDNGIRFGKGLQLVNVLRDLPADLKNGRCYIPSESLAKVGLEPSSLLRRESESQFRPVFRGLLDLAESHLEAGWKYTNTLPRECIRLRLACAWPILIGFATLGKLGNGPILDPGHRIKVSRAEVRSIITRSVILYPFPNMWRNLASRVSSKDGDGGQNPSRAQTRR